MDLDVQKMVKLLAINVFFDLDLAEIPDSHKI